MAQPISLLADALLAWFPFYRSIKSLIILACAYWRLEVRIGNWYRLLTLSLPRCSIRSLLGLYSNAVRGKSISLCPSSTLHQGSSITCWSSCLGPLSSDPSAGCRCGRSTLEVPLVVCLLVAPVTHLARPYAAGTANLRRQLQVQEQ